MREQIKKWLAYAVEHQGLRRYGSNVLWLMGEKSVRLLLGLLVGIYVARQLGPAQYGLLNYAISFVAIFSVIGSLGMDAITVRELVRHPEKSDSLLGTAFCLKLCGFAGMVVILAGILLFSPMDFAAKLLIGVILSGYAFQTLQILDSYFQSRVLSRYTVISQLGALLIISAFRLYLAWKQAPLWTFAVAEAGYMGLSAAGYAASYLFLGGRFRRWNYDAPTAKFLFRESLPLLFSGAASMIYIRIDQVMVTWMLGDAANGQYAVAVRIVEILYLVPLAVESSFFPSLIGTRGTSLRRYYRRTEQLMRSMFYFALLLVIPASLGGRWAIEWLYGPAYYTGALLYSVFAFKILLVYPGLICGKWYIAENLQSLSMWISIAGAGFNIAANYFLILRYGVFGAVYATILTSFCVNFIFPLPFRKGRQAVRLLLRALLPAFSI
ncbi:MAG: flippase [Victivallales bacterium]|jgi:O-antigen/teichoic acid export membrane protein|nr:flippase [Victivallales bacterium]